MGEKGARTRAGRMSQSSHDRAVFFMRRASKRRNVAVVAMIINTVERMYIFAGDSSMVGSCVWRGWER